MFKILIIICISLLPFLTFAESKLEKLNIGMVSGLWFSEDVFFDGQEIILNSAFFNNSEFDIIATIIFYDNGKEFYKDEFDVEKGKIHVSKIPYTTSAGEHTWKAKLFKTVKKKTGEEILGKKNIVLSQEKMLIGYDTDGDMIDDIFDEDDDNDGYSDEVEKKYGSDPQDKNSNPMSIIEDRKKKVDRKNSEKREIDGYIKKISDIGDGVFKNSNELREKIEYFLKEEISNNIESEKEKVIFVKNKKENDTINVIKNINSEHKIKMEERNYYLFFLEILHYIFSSIFLSIIFFLSIFYSGYKVLRFFYRKKS